MSDPNSQQPDKASFTTGSFNDSLRNIRDRVFEEQGDRGAGAPYAQPATAFNEEKKEADFYITEEELEMLTFYDGVKGIYKLRYFMQTLFRELKRSKRFNRTTSVVVAQIDGYQNVLRQYGPATADQISGAVVKLLLDGARSDLDTIGKLSADRYVLLLPETPGRGAAVLCDRLQKKLSTMEFKHNWTVLPVTLSFGVSYYPGHANDPTELIARADLACEFVTDRGGGNTAFA
ncbi:MAG: GGDEF domain-containing protein [Cyanobacteria bacterium REEB67]|nr:GGDEF domain-containing protein [Cyanobacteria bacterium REEB67]